MEDLVTWRDQAFHDAPLWWQIRCTCVVVASQLLVTSLRVAVSDGIYVEWAIASSRWALASLP